MSQLVEDCLRIILAELNNDLNSLYSCILVNRFWCIVGVQILWKNSYEFLNHNYMRKHHKSIRNYETLQFSKFCDTIICLLPTSSKQLLIENDVISPSTHFLYKPLFNYISFFSEISTSLIGDMGLALIMEVNNSLRYQEKYEMLEQELYKLFISNCKDITYFCWSTSLPLHQYPGALTLFSQLHTFGIECNQNLISEKLFVIAKICQSIENLKIWNCDRNIPGLIEFIDNQKNLQSLYLHCKCHEMKCTQLIEAIERKAIRLRLIILRGVLLSPKLFLSLINLEYLKVKVESNLYSKQSVQELQKYLSICSFPKLQYLKVQYLPPHGICKLIENSHENIKEISIWDDLMVNDSVYTKVIINNCPNIESLKINIQLKNLVIIKEIFLNCRKLRKLSLHLYNCGDDDDVRVITCNEVLNVLLNYSPETFEEFSFNDEWYFSGKGLQNFFEGWRGRKPIKFVTLFDDDCYHFTRRHINILKKYCYEGVIDKETRYLYGVK
ncbi:hypothetical protein RclHR1_04660008 [Rhizophagus clarus]|uniref:F-box domain-containing protein n=1 Tax=Rhizophagus clarus TaxID=94130 RepID=A0A2Z6RW04_9GLOM|nr:hypothetical protein RclHR1_04660008 [Rhizophagus clarus]GES81642.1 hypothetical protein GLOIN_2v1768247 [Rhizophagus clarus]